MKSNFQKKLDHERIVEAIARAEKTSTGEIRVRITNRSILFFQDEMGFARKVFRQLKMSQTRERNGVLLVIFPKRRTIVILGDRGIHEQLGQKFWDQTVEGAIKDFKSNDYTAGIIGAINQVGEALAKHFPPSGSSSNELPNKVIED